MSSAVYSPLFTATLRSSGPILFAGLQLSSLDTARRIYINKSVKICPSPLPFISLCTNCCIWSLYGYLRKDLTVLIPNATGIFVGLICSFIHKLFDKSESTRVLYGVSGALIMYAFYCYKLKYTSEIGLLGCIISIVLSGSPLTAMKTVITEQSTASLPFPTSLILWLNSICWLSYGVLIANDPMIYGPNALGFVLSSVQMLLFAIYGIPAKSKQHIPDKLVAV